MRKRFLSFICLQAFLLFTENTRGVISSDFKATVAAIDGKNENGSYPGHSLGKAATPVDSMCFDTSTIRTCGDTITSSNTIIRSPVVYDSSTMNYPNNVDCSWTIRAPLGYVVRFEFLCFFRTEATSIWPTCDHDDYLEIRNTSGQIAARYCGLHVLSDLDAYETDENEATLTFHTNSALTEQGFVLRVDFVKKYDSMCFDTSTIRTCDAIITSNNAVLRSPVADYNTWVYPNNVDCSWTIRAPIGYVVRIEFLCFFSTEAISIGPTCLDYLSIKDKSDDIRYCGAHVHEHLDDYVTDGNEVTLMFHSNSAVESLGFVVRAVFVKIYDSMCSDTSTIRRCGDTITSSNTILRSPVVDDSSSMNYPNNVDCSWTIRAPIGYVVRFEFLCFFHTEATSIWHTCEHDDYLEITWRNSSGQIAAQYCGLHVLSDLDAYETDGNEATLTFHTNSAVTEQGFVLRVDFVKKYPGTFSSAAFPAFNRAMILVCLFASILTSG